MGHRLNCVTDPCRSPSGMEDLLRLELSATLLLRLLVEGRLCAADFRCLDGETHRCVRRLLLRSCLETQRRRHGCGYDGLGYDRIDSKIRGSKP